MARVTVEDCIKKVQNRFDLVVFAVQRGKEISAGDEITVERDNDKNTVVSLREIAESTVDTEDIKENLIASMQKQIVQEDENVSEEEETINVGTEENIVNDIEKNYFEGQLDHLSLIKKRTNLPILRKDFIMI